MTGKGNSQLSFLGNRPLVISLLYCATFFTGITGLIGVVLAYLFRDAAQEEWEVSHYPYLIRTFWIFILSVSLVIAAAIMMMGDVRLGGLLLIPAGVLVLLSGVRAVMSLINAALEKPMPSPKSWLI